MLMIPSTGLGMYPGLTARERCIKSPAKKWRPFLEKHLFLKKCLPF